MILVTGATGTVGSDVVAQLVSAGAAVRALTRDPAKARFDPRVTVVQGDLAKPETLSKALDGVDRVFSVATGPNLGTHEANLASRRQEGRREAHREALCPQRRPGS